MPPLCQSCWEESGHDLALYSILVKARPCTPEEEAGPQAAQCPTCGRFTIHPSNDQCVNRDCADWEDDR